ncbi:MAG: hypothetical protein OES57_01290 [Acidimicrobiia bacterium]|nr:hypothetical protein [Acidimicrobiia bacterium]
MKGHRRSPLAAPVTLALAVALAVVAIVGVSPAAAQYGGTQGFVIDPPVINTGDTVSMLGTGCQDASTVVFTIEPLGITLGQTTPLANGDFFLPDVTLDLAPGVYPVTATCGDVSMVAQVTVLAVGAGVGIDTDGDGIPDSVAFTGAGTLVVKLALVVLCLGSFILLAGKRRTDDEDESLRQAMPA